MKSAVLLLGLLASAPERKLVDRVVAVVNEDIITLSQLDAAAKPFLGELESPEKRQALYKDLLDQLIAEQLITQQITEAKITVSEEETDRAIKDILRQNNIGEEELRQAVEARSMSMGQYREDLKKQLVRLKIVDTKVRSRVVVPESEIRSEWERSVAGEKKEELISIRHLFFRYGDAKDPADRERVRRKAEAARARIAGGEDFAKVAQEVSEGPTAQSGGDLGEVSKKGLLPELAQVIQTLEVNQLSAPIDTTNGVHVVRVEGRRVKEASPYSEMRNQIYQRLYQAEVERQMKVWVDELKQTAVIQSRL